MDALLFSLSLGSVKMTAAAAARLACGEATLSMASPKASLSALLVLPVLPLTAPTNKPNLSAQPS